MLTRRGEVSLKDVSSGKLLSKRKRDLVKEKSAAVGKKRRTVGRDILPGAPNTEEDDSFPKEYDLGTSAEVLKKMFSVVPPSGSLSLGVVGRIQTNKAVIHLPNGLYGQADASSWGESGKVIWQEMQRLRMKSTPFASESAVVDHLLQKKQSLEVGQFVVCVVVGEADSSSFHKKEIQVSLTPSLVNARIRDHSKVELNQFFAACVLSVEPRGLIVSPCVQSEDSAKPSGQSLRLRDFSFFAQTNFAGNYSLGDTVAISVTDIKPSKRLVVCQVLDGHEQRYLPISSDIDSGSLLPGQLLECSIQQVLSDPRGIKKSVARAEKLGDMMPILNKGKTRYFSESILHLAFGKHLLRKFTALPNHTHLPTVGCRPEPKAEHIPKKSCRVSFPFLGKAEDDANDNEFPFRCPVFTGDTKCLARIISIIPNSEFTVGSGNTHMYYVSLLPHIVWWHPRNDIPFNVGQIVKPCVFQASPSGVKGLLNASGRPSSTVEEDNSSSIRVHDLAIQNHLTPQSTYSVFCYKLQKEAEGYRLYQSLQMRITSINLMDQCVVCTDKADILKEKYFSASDVRMGEVLNVTVVGTRDWGVLTRLSSFVLGGIRTAFLNKGAKMLPRMTEKMKVKVRVWEVDSAFIQLTNHQQLLELSNEELENMAPANLKIGVVFAGVVMSVVNNIGLVVRGFGGVNALLFYSDILANDEELKSPSSSKEERALAVESITDSQKYQIGCVVKGYISSVASPKKVNMSLAMPGSGQDSSTDGLFKEDISRDENVEDAVFRSRMKMDCPLPFAFDADKESLLEIAHKALVHYPVGCIVKGKVRSVMENTFAIVCTIHGKLQAMVHVTEFGDLDDMDGYPLRRMKINDTVLLKIMGVCEAMRFDPMRVLEGTLRVDTEVDSSKTVRSPSGKVVIRQYTDVSPGDTVSGVILKASLQHGVFVGLGARVQSRIHVRRLKHQDALAGELEMARYYSPGKVLHNIKVIQVDASQKLLEGSEDLDEPVVTGRTREQVLEAACKVLEVGEICEGTVRNVKDCGLFIGLRSRKIDEEVVALCRPDEQYDDESEAIEYQIGDTVLAKVTAVDPERHRIRIGLKRSYFEGYKFEPETEAPAAPPVDEEEETPSDLDSSSSPGSVEGGSSGALDVSMDEPSAAVLPFTEVAAVELVDSTTAGAADEAVAEKPSSASPPRKKRKSGGVAEEMELIAEEERLAGNDWRLNPQSEEDFEKLIIYDKNNSETWMKYLAFHLNQQNLTSAREIGQRALDSIDFRNEQDKYNIWIALLNMEYTFGTEQEQQDCLNRSLQYNSKKPILLHVCKFLEKQFKYSQSDEMFKRLLKLYRDDEKVLTHYLKVLYARDTVACLGGTVPPPEKSPHIACAREFLESSHIVKALPKKLKVQLQVTGARLEFEYGTPMRGRTMFETVLADCPKRCDIWSQLFDCEMALLRRHTEGGDVSSGVSQADIKSSRRAFSDAAKIDLKPKQMKFVFTRWLEFEKTFGNEKSISQCKEVAQQYVTKQTEN